MSKRNRKKWSDHKFKHRAGWSDKHHLRPKSRGGSDRRYNKITLDAYRHDAYHLLFGNLSLDEVIELLTRLRDKKANQF